MVDPDDVALSLTRQCRLVSIARSSFYYEGKDESLFNVQLLRRIDEQFLETPFYGSRQMTRWLRRQEIWVSRKRVRRLMRRLGLQAIFQRPRTSQPHPEHRIYPYLLRDLAIMRPNQVWCSDVTIPLARGFLYLVVVMDWASRKVLAWRLSNTLDSSFCVEALHEALDRYGSPEIFNTDQGSQFTSLAFTDVLTDAGSSPSFVREPEGNGVAERFIRTLKENLLWVRSFETIEELRLALLEFKRTYNEQWMLEKYDYRSPAQVRRDLLGLDAAA